MNPINYHVETQDDEFDVTFDSSYRPSLMQVIKKRL